MKRLAVCVLASVVLASCGLIELFESGDHFGAVSLVAEAKLVHDQLQVEGLDPEQETALKAKLLDLLTQIVFPPNGEIEPTPPVPEKV